MTDAAKHLIIGDGDVVATANQSPLELDKLIVTRLLVQANSGGGKSHAIRWLLEQTYGRIQHIVIDREGEFSTLRAIKPRMTDLLVGRDGDVAADTGTAKLLARKVLELGLSTVVDLSEMTPGQQRAYVRVFIDSINHAPRTLWKDCLIVIDEAHIFAPQKGESEARETIALLLSTGRKRGFCAVLATQRIAKLDKDVSAECLNKLIGRTSNEDLKRAAEELAQDKQSSIQLRNLEPGTFWAYGPAIATEPTLVRTGKVKTQPPARGAERSTPPAAPEEIRAALAQELAELPKQAADEAQTLVALQRQVADLSRELGIAKQAQGEPRVEYVQDEKAIAEMRRYVENMKVLERQLLDDARQGALNALGELTTLHDKVVKLVTQEWWEPMPTMDKFAATQKVEYLRTQVTMPPRHYKEPSPLQRAARDVELQPRDRINGELPRGALKMLQVLARRPSMELTRAQLGTLAGFASSGGTFGEYLRQLKRAGYVTEAGKSVAITNPGYAKVGAQPAPNPDEVWQMWVNNLNAGQVRILETLRRWRTGASRDRVAAESGLTSSAGTFGEYVRVLKRNNLVTEESGYLRLSPELAA